MTIHAFIELLRYKWTAKSRHGVHSPFVYAFCENVLLDKKAEKETKGYSWMPAKYNRLLNKIIKFYGYGEVVQATTDVEEEPTSFDLLLLDPMSTGNWVKNFNKYQPLLKNNSAVLVAGIHLNKRHTAKWNRLLKHPKVRTSIDLNGVGLLFFNQDFKEKQHFVLKY